MESQSRLKIADTSDEDELQSQPEQRVSGRVKWFDVVKGYGFLVPDEGGEDVLIHYNLLSQHGRKSLPEGARLVALAKAGPRGRQASVLLEVDAPPPEQERTRAKAEVNAGPRSSPLDFLDEAGDFEAVEVRWFNRAKGYGFLLRSDGVTEVFIHMETVRRAGFTTLVPEQRCIARIHDGPRGALAVVLGEAEGEARR